MQPHKILFVCMGNICRSPAAEGVFRKLVVQRGLENQFEIDSAGTGRWHIGCPPDKRAQQAASARDIDISNLMARQVCVADTQYYDNIIAMDSDNQSRLLELADESHRCKVRLLLEYADSADNLEVPDPYYGGENGFEQVLDLLEDACQKLLDQLLAQRHTL